MNLVESVKAWLFSGEKEGGFVPVEKPLVIRYHIPREELKMILRRGLNTLDPQKLPEWAVDLADDVEATEDVAFNIRVSA